MSGSSGVTRNELVIEKVRGCELLYNINLPSYKDPQMRQAAWEEIGRDINMKGDAVRYTWDKLRRCFLNAIKRRNIKHTDEIIKGPMWRYQEQMAFLLPFMGGRGKARKRLCENEEESYDDDFESIEDVKVNNLSEHLEEDELNIKPEVTIVAKTDESESSFIEITNARESVAVNSRCEECELREKDETDMFFLSMARTTKRLPVVEQARIKLLLGNAVLRAQLKVNGDPNYQNYSSFENGAFY